MMLSTYPARRREQSIDPLPTTVGLRRYQRQIQEILYRDTIETTGIKGHTARGDTSAEIRAHVGSLEIASDARLVKRRVHRVYTPGERSDFPAICARARTICIPAPNFSINGGRMRTGGAGKLNCRGTVFLRRVFISYRPVVVKSRTFSARQLVRLCNEFKTEKRLVVDRKRDRERERAAPLLCIPITAVTKLPALERPARSFEIFFPPPLPLAKILSFSLSLSSSSSSECSASIRDFYARISRQLTRRAAASDDKNRKERGRDTFV